MSDKGKLTIDVMKLPIPNHCPDCHWMLEIKEKYHAYCQTDWMYLVECENCGKQFVWRSLLETTELCKEPLEKDKK